MRSLNSLTNSRFGTHLADAIAWIIFLLKHAGWQILVLAFMILFRPEISNFISPALEHQVVAPQTVVVPQYVGTANVCVIVSGYYVPKHGESLEKALEHHNITSGKPIKISELGYIKEKMDSFKEIDKDLTIELKVVRCDTGKEI